MPRTRVVLLAWLATSAWSGSLHLKAAIDPPPGQVFVGTFHWVDDFYNYVSYAQQAEDGRFLFCNKLRDPREARPVLVNLEWWLVGRLSRALSRRPFLAYRILGLVATLTLVAALEQWLARLAVPIGHRLAALMLVLFGGGLGGLLFMATPLTVQHCVDLSIGVFPFLEILANPHFTAATALVLWSLWCYSEVRTPWGPWLGCGLGTILGLVRPYDVGLVGLLGGGTVLLTVPPRRWVRSLIPLAGLLPVAAYDAWTFFGSDQFASFWRGSPFPTGLEFLTAVGPAALLAGLGARQPLDATARRAVAPLYVWGSAALALILLRPGGFALQLLVGAGVPLLLLAARGLSRFAPVWTLVVAMGMSSSALVASHIVFGQDPAWFVPQERVAAALALRRLCTGTDILLAPADISLYAMGLASCHVFVGHPNAPDYAARIDEARAFYETERADARDALLDQHRITRLVLPGFAGLRPTKWLGAETPFAAAATVGQGSRQLTIYARGPVSAESAASPRAGMMAAQ